MKRLTHFLHVGLFMTILNLIIQNPVFSQDVTLAWSPSTNPDIASYGIYRSAQSDTNFVLINTITHPDTIYIDDTADFNVHYFYAATSIDQYGNESGFSNRIDTLLSAVTPVELSHFTCQLVEKNVLINWVTESELNNFGFEIQKSENTTTDFQKIGFINGNGTSNDPHNYEFLDNDVTTGIYYYRLKQIDYSGVYKYSKSIEVAVNIPNKFYLAQNYPNPFNSSTSISYTLPVAGHVHFTIYNTNGKEVYQAENEFQEAGTHTLQWNGLGQSGENLASGVYYYKIVSNKLSSFKKMTLLK